MKGWNHQDKLWLTLAAGLFIFFLSLPILLYACSP